MDGVELLEDTYGRVTRAVEAGDEGDLSRATRTSEWTVRELLLHLLLDARRALVALATTTTERPDVDAVEYWRPFRPSNGDGGATAAGQVRRSAAAYARGMDLVEEWRETSTAAVSAARASSATTHVRTQGHVLAVPDFVSTLVVEATVHLLDLTLELPGDPAPEAMGHTRAVLEGLLGDRLPASWDDRTAVLRGTGREPLTVADVVDLGPLVERFPLLG